MDELRDLLQPMILNWRAAEFDRWIHDFRQNTDLRICIFQSLQGYTDIYKDPFTRVGIRCDPQPDGQLLLTPYVLEGATPAAVAELRQWRDALAAAGGLMPTEVDPTALGIRAKQLGIRTDRLLRWDRILQDYRPKGLTQEQIAEGEDRDIKTIKNDYKLMRGKGLLPPLRTKSTP